MAVGSGFRRPQRIAAGMRQLVEQRRIVDPARLAVEGAVGGAGERDRRFGAVGHVYLSDNHPRQGPCGAGERLDRLGEPLGLQQSRRLGLRKGLDHLDAVRTTFQVITDRFAGFQAEWLNVHVDFPLLQRLAHPITIGAVRYPGLKIHEPRIIRLFEVLLHGGPQIGGWTARQMHQAVLDTFDLSEKTYRLNQLRYDLRKLKGHGLIERDGSRYAYRLSPKGVQVALLFLFFHKRLCGPLANSRFHHRPDPQHRPDSRLEAAYHRADTAIQRVVDLLAAA